MLLRSVVIAAVALGFAWYVSQQPMDFRVYYYGAEGVLDGTRPVYGNNSGLGWPMHYRYPPLFMLLAFSLTWLSLPWAAAVWTVLKVTALAAVVIVLWNRLGRTSSAKAWLVPLLLAGPYVVEDLRYGNAQSFMFALTAAALLLLPRAPRWAAAALSLGAIVKVWPLFFVPYLAARREWKAAGWTVVFTILLALVPAVYFGFAGNLDLLRQWTAQEFATQTSQSEIWFPSQSLRGVMMRYLTVLDYSQLPDSNYRQIHVAALDAGMIRAVWLGLAAAGYVGLLSIASRRHRFGFGLTEALAFSSLILLQPFSQKYALVVLLWPAMVAGRLVEKNSRMRVLLYGAIAVTLIQPLIQGATAQRLLQVLGMDFLATALLTAFLVVATLSSPTEPVSEQGVEYRYYSRDTRIP